eukprot:487497_1
MISLNEYSIHVSIAERYASVAYKFAFENTSDLNQSDELRFEMTIDPDAFISGFEASIDGELFIGKTKEKKQAKQEYVAAKEKNENAILITQPFPDIPNVFQVKTNIDSQSKIVLTIHIEQYLKKKLHFNALNIQIVKAFHKYNITQKCDHIQLNMDIADQRGIYDLQLPSNNKALIIDTNIFSETLHQIRAKVLKDSTLNELCLKYKVKGEQNESHVFYDKSSDTFVHQISDIISDSVVDEVGALDKTKHCIMIPRRVVFIIDKSGSMSGIKWTKTLLATVTALKQLRVDHDRYCLVFFDSQIELSSNIGMLLAGSCNISQSIQYVEDQSTGGATNINAALLKGIELIKNDTKMVDKDDLFQNQMIFITDGEPNSGETDTNNIIGNVEAQNKLDGDDTKICIFCFGVGSDCNDSSWIHDLSHSFLKSLAVNNDGIYKRIKESTCDGQLNEYFDILSRPVLSNVRVEYDGMNEMDLTQHAFNTLYDGNDLIICGQLKHYKSLNMTANISAITGLKIKQQDGTAGIKRIKIRKQICINLGDSEHNTNNPNIERIWAYLKLQQLARQRLINDDMIEFDASDDDIPLRLAMRYKFVTPWTSMIVVKHKTEQSDDKETPEPDTMEDNKNDDDAQRKAYNFDYSVLDQIGPRRKYRMKPWIRQPLFDYSILDQVGSGKKRKPVSSQAIEGKVEKEYERKQNALKQIQPKAAVQAFNPYANVMKNDNAQPKAKKAPVVAKKIVAAPISSNKSLYQQEKEAKLKKSMKQNVGPAPPSFSAAAPPSFSGAAPPSFSAAGKQPKGPPAVPKAAKGPPPVPGGPPAPPGMGGPPPVPR